MIIWVLSERASNPPIPPAPLSADPVCPFKRFLRWQHRSFIGEHVCTSGKPAHLECFLLSGYIIAEIFHFTEPEQSRL
jgi:hypothetical protein